MFVPSNHTLETYQVSGATFTIPNNVIICKVTTALLESDGTYKDEKVLQDNFITTMFRLLPIIIPEKLPFKVDIFVPYDLAICSIHLNDKMITAINASKFSAGLGNRCIAVNISILSPPAAIIDSELKK